jgi:hypothetical protein
MPRSVDRPATAVKPGTRDWLRKHSLGLALTAMFVLMTAFTIVTGIPEFRTEQADHGQPFAWPAFWLWWSHEYMLSLVADVFGALILVLMTKRLYEIGSAESN